MHLLNFAHPLTSEQMTAFTEAIGVPDQVTRVPLHFDTELPFADQVRDLLDSLPISTQEWQAEAWVIVPPSLNVITAVLLAELHGRMGHFPAVLRLRPERGAVTTRYVFAEVINLEAVRTDARQKRAR